MVGQPLNSNVTCDGCRLTTSASVLLATVPVSFKIGAALHLRLCPRCRAAREARTQGIMFLANIGIVAAFVAFEASQRHALNRDLAFTLTSAVLAAALSGPILVIAHEAAHALVAKCVGIRVLGVRVGTGRRFLLLPLGKAFVELRLVPVRGVCFYAIGERLPQRWEAMLATAAGPAVHLAAMLALIACFGFNADLLNLDSHPQNIAPAIFFLFNLVMFVANLYPREFNDEGRKCFTDGKRLLSLLREPGHAGRWFAAAQPLAALRLLEVNRPALARDALEQARVWDAASPRFQIAELAVLSVEGQWTVVGDRSRERLKSAGDFGHRIGLLYWHALATVYLRGDPSDANAASAEITAAVPWEPAAQALCALVALVENRLDDCRRAIAMTGRERFALDARVREEFFRRTGQPRLHARWAAIAERLDPNGHYRVPPHGSSTLAPSGVSLNS